MMKPWSAGSVYVNGLSEDDSGRVKEAFGENFERLCEIKAQYDLQNRFRRNQNIPPRAIHRTPHVEARRAVQA
jgi:hypothetical protein